MQTPGVLIRHISFLNVSEFQEENENKIIYMNMVRDPAERMVSWFYYIRNPKVVENWSKNNKDINLRSQHYLNQVLFYDNKYLNLFLYL